MECIVFLANIYHLGYPLDASQFRVLYTRLTANGQPSETSVKVFFQIVFLSFSLCGMTPSFGGPSGLFVSEDGFLPPRRRRPSSGIFILARFGA